MGINLEAFHQQIQKIALSETEIQKKEATMKVLNIICYSVHETVGEVNFDSFTVSDCENAMVDLVYYYPDEYVDSDDRETLRGNRETMLNEINRIAHLKQTADRLVKSSKTKKAFF